MIILDTIIVDGEKFEIYYSSTLTECPALPLILETYSELLKKEWAIQGLSFRNSSMAVWVQDSKNKILGGICFDYVADRKEGWINLSFTDPGYRGKGINKLCHAHFEKTCKELGATSIGSIVAVDNISRLKSAKKVGLQANFYRMYKVL